MSLVGYITEPKNDLNFLFMRDQEGEDYGYIDFIKTVDTLIVGRKIYCKIISMGYDFQHADKALYIITRTMRPSIGKVNFYTGSLFRPNAIKFTQSS
jgi:dihydrofolate reductase